MHMAVTELVTLNQSGYSSRKKNGLSCQHLSVCVRERSPLVPFWLHIVVKRGWMPLELTTKELVVETRNRWLRAKRVRERYDDIGEVTLWRWVNDPKSDFPKPVKRNGVRYWDERTLDLYDQRLLTAGAA